MLAWPLRFKPLQDTKQLLRQPKKRMHQYCMPQYPTCTTNARHVYGIRQTRVRHKADTYDTMQIVLATKADCVGICIV